MFATNFSNPISRRIRSRVKVHECSILRSKSKETGQQSGRLSPPELHCMNVVKKYDYENFLCLLFHPGKELRRTAFALRALNVELAQIRDTTQSDQLAQIRFQFWSDLINEIYSKCQTSEQVAASVKYQNFPLALELYHVLSGSHLSKNWLLKLITTRRDPRYLSEFPFQTLEELEKYGQATVVTLYYLLNEKSISLKEPPPPVASYRISLDHAASHLGKAQWLTNVLRGVVHNARHRRCYIPNELLVRYRCSHEDFLQLNGSSPAVRDVAFEIASHAHVHLEHVEKIVSPESPPPVIGKEDRLLFLAQIPLKTYLLQLQRYNFDIFDLRLHRRNGWLPWKLWWASRSWWPPTFLSGSS